jgi:hypothetical protein
MLKFYNYYLQAIVVSGAIALTWLTVFKVNMWLFSHLALTEYIHWIFLPAGFRLIAVLLFGLRGALGLMLGAYLTLSGGSTDDLSHEILLSVSSGLAPLLAVMFCQRLFTIRNDLAGLNAWHVIVLSVSCAVTNSVVLSSLLWAIDTQQADFIAIMAIFVGDVIGAAVVIGAIALILDSALRLIRRAR